MAKSPKLHPETTKILSTPTGQNLLREAMTGKALSPESRQALESLRSSESQSEDLETGADLHVLIAGADLGALYIQKGVLHFGLWAKTIIDELRSIGVDPEQIKPHLKKIYAATQQTATDEQFDEMDDMRTVRKFNLDEL